VIATGVNTDGPARGHAERDPDGARDGSVSSVRGASDNPFAQILRSILAWTEPDTDETGALWTGHLPRSWAQPSAAEGIGSSAA